VVCASFFFLKTRSEGEACQFFEVHNSIILPVQSIVVLLKNDMPFMFLDF